MALSLESLEVLDAIERKGSFAAAAHGAWEAHAAGVVMHMQVRSTRDPW